MTCKPDYFDKTLTIIENICDNLEKEQNKRDMMLVKRLRDVLKEAKSQTFALNAAYAEKYSKT